MITQESTLEYLPVIFLSSVCVISGQSIIGRSNRLTSVAPFLLFQSVILGVINDGRPSRYAPITGTFRPEQVGARMAV